LCLRLPSRSSPLTHWRTLTVHDPPYLSPKLISTPVYFFPPPLRLGELSFKSSFTPFPVLGRTSNRHSPQAESSSFALNYPPLFLRECLRYLSVSWDFLPVSEQSPSDRTFFFRARMGFLPVLLGPFRPLANAED